MQNLDIVNLIPKKVLVSRLIFPLEVVHSSDHHWPQVMGSEEERRSKILRDYYELRRTHPELPAQLRDFQVEENCCTVHLKIFRWTYFVVPWMKLQPHHGGTANRIWEEHSNAPVGPPHAQRYVWHLAPKQPDNTSMWNDFQLSVLCILCTLIEFTHFPNRLHSIYCVTLDNNWRPTPDRLWAHGNPCSGWKQGMFLYSADFRSCFLWTNMW